MTGSYRPIPLAQVQPGMTLSDELLDMHGHVLLPEGTVLTEALLALMPRHGIDVLPIVATVDPAELAALHEHQRERVDYLFRPPGGDADAEPGPSRALLQRLVHDYRTDTTP
ncbi:hypothetical protein [Pseudoduganella chitinolytica]|uniref:Uncharacterized protein n=1 Tax=Pseudoduganella chitinolytica TaxID=34070 RepID=A0ABY8B801_9BURK|nr:hypothetical protein [Pseudoduganella chitinolytica]WEF31158.1 hypothetical protein PX653_16995 [Pseudoduganella chitinolytica]